MCTLTLCLLYGSSQNAHVTCKWLRNSLKNPSSGQYGTLSSMGEGQHLNNIDRMEELSRWLDDRAQGDSFVQCYPRAKIVQIPFAQQCEV